MDKSKLIIINLSIIIVIVLAIFIIRPAYLGYVTYQGIKASNVSLEDYGKNIQDLKESMLVSTTNLSTCYDFNQILIEQLDKFSDDIAVCNKQLSDYAILEEKYKIQVDELKKTIEERQTEAAQYKNDYEQLVQNLANKICCKMKIDNNKINYYKVEDNNILCLEQGENQISCSFG